MVHIGVDLHKRFSQIAVLGDGQDVQQHRLENAVKRLADFFGRWPAPTKVAVEASGSWWWFVDLVQGLGPEAVLSHPKQTKAIAAARLKNDRVDAARLALLLRGELLPTVWIPPASLREARELVRHRLVLVWTRTRVKNRLHAMLAKRNLRPVVGQSWFTVRGPRALEGLVLSEAATTIREQSLTLLRHLDQQIAAIEATLVAQWGADPRVQRLMTLPGIGRASAITLVIELGDVARFPSAKHVASYLGVTPRVHSSADQIRSGPITKEGNRLLRWVLVGAATQAARQPGPVRAWARALQAKRGKQVARVARARRLAGLVYHVWKEEGDYLTCLRQAGVRG